ncbi:MAG TPA: HNH endonuclease [Candidatus Corynebacterium gallistercoris]|uniref:HNH endonuclease n=1 Tax=Candidatus Corynebacterium gallistercoris TaxID=2838530 RepID=A0A9D1S030_9CORY|nr:HNH endonuclease [Candidatus Corynebacterium gallistercoris]
MSESVSAPQSVASFADQICAAVEGLQDLLAEPSVKFFDENEAELVRALNALNRTDGLFGSFAHAADIAGASRRVGSTRTSDYLQKRLDTTFVQAMRWLDIGKAMHQPEPVEPDEPVEPQKMEEPADLFGEQADAEADAGSEAEPNAEPPQEDTKAAGDESKDSRDEEKEREKRRRRRGISNAKLTIIRDELRHLDDAIVDAVRPGLFERACEQAPDRTPEDLRVWVQREVRRANAAVSDPLQDIRNRSMSWSKPDHNGNTTVRIVLPRFAHSLLDTLFAPQNLVAMEKQRGDYVEGDKRNLQQRRCDAFISLLEGVASAGDAARTGRERGLASLVVAVSARDLERLAENAALPEGAAGKIASAGTSQLMPTNTNAGLSALDILRLGLAAYDYGVALDPFSGRAKAGGRVQRHASVEQKLMLIAEQLGCSHPGCTEPACNSDVHHIVAFAQGGRTDIENLTLLCRRHHRLNRDARDGRAGMGNAAVDPVTKRKCWMDGLDKALGEELGGASQNGPPRRRIRFNHSTRAQNAPGYRVAKQRWRSMDLCARAESGALAKLGLEFDLPG